MRRARNIAALTALALLASTGNAAAGRYDVTVGPCDASGRSAFEFFADPGLEAIDECTSELVVARSGVSPVGNGASASAVLAAPNGTTFEGIDWHGGYARVNCQWDVVLVAGKDPRPAAGLQAFENCDAASWRGQQSITLNRAKSMSLEVRCQEPTGCPALPGPDFMIAASIDLSRSVLTVDDDVAPSVDVVPLGTFPGRWVRGVQPLRYEARDGSGIREATLVLPGQRHSNRATCDYTRLSPCPQGPGQLSVDTTQLADGVHPIAVEVADAGSNASSDSTSAHIDNTPPARVQPDVDGGSGWRRQNAFGVSWSAAPEPYAPITTAHYRLCRAGTNDCVRGMRGRNFGDFSELERLPDISVPGPGEWTLEVWREDEAGNVDERLASAPVLVRLDDAPPALRFEPRQLEDPRRVSAVVTDGVSGVAGGEIQLRPAGGGAWQSLPTVLDRGRLTTEIDDERLSPGAYELRAVAHDHAGNERATYTLPDGSAAVLRLPLRAQTRLTAGVPETKSKRKGKRKPRLLHTAKATFGARVRLSGRLTNHDGRTVAGTRVYVYSSSRVGEERFAGVANTNRAGEFSYPLKARASGTVRIRYPGSRLLGPAERKVTLEVPAASRLKVNDRKVLNGDEVVFTGRLRGGPFPRPGKIIHLQAHFARKGWTNFGKPHRAEPNGRWRIPYTFDNTRGLVRYRFRVLVPEEANYPYETGASNIVRVTVRGR